jgi:hypothetical protein
MLGTAIIREIRKGGTGYQAYSMLIRRAMVGEFGGANVTAARVCSTIMTAP